MNLKVMFDLDDTLIIGDTIETISRKLYNEGKLNKIYTNRDVTSYDLLSLPTNLRFEILEAFKDENYAVNNKTVMPGCYYMLHSLYSFNVELGILTSRAKNLEPATKAFLRNHFVGVEFKLGIHFANKENTVDMITMPPKKQTLELIKPDVYFDDHLAYCMQSASLGIKTYLVSNDHTPWNKTEYQYGIEIIKNPCFVDLNKLFQKHK